MMTSKKIEDVQQIEPQGSWILIRPIPRKEKAGSLYIPIETGVEKVGHSIGEVLKIPSPLYKNQTSKAQIKDPGFVVGDHVLYRDYLKNIHEFFSESGERYCLMCWEDFIAVVDKDLRSSAEGLVNE